MDINSDFVCRKLCRQACSMDIILSKYAVLESLLRRAVTIVRDTSTTSSSQSLKIQSGSQLVNYIFISFFIIFYIHIYFKFIVITM